MSDLPKLGPRAINAYNRFAKELAAFNYVLQHSKTSGPAGPMTLFTLNGLILAARRLFRRHADMPLFIPVAIDEPMSLTDLGIQIARLNAASLHFEERYIHLTAEAIRPDRAG